MSAAKPRDHKVAPLHQTSSRWIAFLFTAREPDSKVSLLAKLLEYEIRAGNLEVEE